MCATSCGGWDSRRGGSTASTSVAAGGIGVGWEGVHPLHPGGTLPSRLILAAGICTFLRCAPGGDCRIALPLLLPEPTTYAKWGRSPGSLANAGWGARLMTSQPVVPQPQQCQIERIRAQFNVSNKAVLDVHATDCSEATTSLSCASCAATCHAHLARAKMGGACRRHARVGAARRR